MIYCANCGLANRDGSRFCNGCGERLVGLANCPHCGFANPPTGNFCNQCGRALGSSLASPASGSPTDNARLSESRVAEETAPRAREEDSSFEFELPNLSELLSQPEAASSQAEQEDLASWELPTLADIAPLPEAVSLADVSAPFDAVGLPATPPHVEGDERLSGDALLADLSDLLVDQAPEPFESLPSAALQDDSSLLEALLPEAGDLAEASLSTADSLVTPDMADAGLLLDAAQPPSLTADEPLSVEPAAPAEDLPDWLAEASCERPRNDLSLSDLTATLSLPLISEPRPESNGSNVCGLSAARSGVASLAAPVAVAPVASPERNGDGALFGQVAGGLQSAAATGTLSHPSQRTGGARRIVAWPLLILLLVLVVVAALLLGIKMGWLPLRWLSPFQNLLLR